MNALRRIALALPGESRRDSRLVGRARKRPGVSRGGNQESGHGTSLGTRSAWSKQSFLLTNDVCKPICRFAAPVDQSRTILNVISNDSHCLGSDGHYDERLVKTRASVPGDDLARVLACMGRLENATQSSVRKT